MPKVISEEFKQKLVSLYERGEPVKKICTEYNIPKSSLYNWIHDYSKVKTHGKLVFTGRQVYLLQKEVALLKEENEILKQCACSVNSPVSLKIQEINKLDKQYNFHAICRALEIRRSNLYYHLNYRSPETIVEQEDEKLKPFIQKIFEDSRNRFGSRMIRAKLIELGVTISQERTVRLMREMDLVCNSSRKLLPEYKRSYPYSKSAYCLNKLQRNFNQEQPNSVWVSDITYLRTCSGIYYLCVIIDLFSRYVISYTLSEIADASLAISTFKNAYGLRKKPKGLMFHIDQGSQYISSKFRKLLKNLNIQQSFSSAGTPYDNAVAETFFASLKRDELYQHIYSDLIELKAAVEEYIDFFNNERPHQRLGFKTPKQAEDNYISRSHPS